MFFSFRNIDSRASAVEKREISCRNVLIALNFMIIDRRLRNNLFFCNIEVARKLQNIYRESCNEMKGLKKLMRN